MARRTSARVLETGSRVQVLCLHATCPTFRAQTVATTGCGCSFSGPKVLPCGRSFYSKGVCFYGMEDYCIGPGGPRCLLYALVSARICCTKGFVIRLVLLTYITTKRSLLAGPSVAAPERSEVAKTHALPVLEPLRRTLMTY